MRRLTLVSLSTLIMASGCASLTPTVQTDPLPVTMPEAYDHSAELAELAEIRSADTHWWVTFNDPVLNDLIERALANNTSVETGLANLRSARAAVTSAGASLLPSLSGSASASSSSDSGLDDISSSARLSASYEVDLFSSNQRSVDVSRLSLLGTQLDQRTIELSVQSDVASNYFNLLTTRYSLQVAKDNLTISERIYQIVEARYNAGDVSGYDLASQQSSLATARARIPAIQDQIESYEASLAILLGETPQGFSVPEADLMSVALPSVDAGLPSELLTRRPDLLSSEVDLQSAHISVAIAEAAYLPSFDLGAGLSTALNSGLDPVASLSAGLNIPIFQGGQLDASLETAEARADAALASYRAAILSALQDVDTSLSGLNSATAQAPDLQIAEDASARALEISELRYRVGADDLTSLLNAQQTYQSAVQSVLENRRDQLISVINLYAAIGGSWQMPIES